MMMTLSLLYQLSVTLFKKFKTYTLDPNQQHPGFTKIYCIDIFEFVLDLVVSRLRRTVLSGFSNVFNLKIMGKSIIINLQC